MTLPPSPLNIAQRADIVRPLDGRGWQGQAESLLHLFNAEARALLDLPERDQVVVRVAVFTYENQNQGVSASFLLTQNS